ncbi:MAG TPA: glycoside hydrolase family 2 TIM barrel-domain containing protein, partial [Candidatus Acidoferrum sp.]|nr:glycoside hydrolase family 2 TIM barrel-domain containing protein [Candidatus Acidoferrum sp.]
MAEAREAEAPFVVGANYWPRRKAMGWWSDFDAGEVRDDFDLAADLGLGALRIFLLWDDFQPTASAVSGVALDQLVSVCDVAAERDLRLDITFFTGHMSGPNWAPRWLLDHGAPVPGERQVISDGRPVAGGYRNPFVDPEAIAAQLLLVGEVVRTLREHPAVWLWNLGNEPDLFALPPHASAGPAWAQILADAIHAVDPVHPVTCGLHTPSLAADNGLRVDRMFGPLDVAAIHGYPVYTDWATGPLDPDLVPFLIAATAALSGRPVLAEEFGAPTAPPGTGTKTLTWSTQAGARSQVLVGEAEYADHLSLVLPRLVEAGAIGALLWCFADYESALWDRPPLDDNRHERFFGLIRADGRPKPHAEVVRAFAATNPLVRS